MDQDVFGIQPAGLVKMAMSHHFHLFGPIHFLLILISGPAVGKLLAVAARQTTFLRAGYVNSLATSLPLSKFIWYGYRMYFEGFPFPEALLPLKLSDLALWLAVLALLTL
jgi:hypothetical protein